MKSVLRRRIRGDRLRWRCGSIPLPAVGLPSACRKHAGMLPQCCRCFALKHAGRTPVLGMPSSNALGRLTAIEYYGPNLDLRAFGGTCALLLAAVSGRSSDAAGVRGDSAEDLGAAPADWIGQGGGGGNRLTEGGWDGEVSEKSLAMRCLQLFSAQRRLICPFQGDGSFAGWKKFKKPAQAEPVGCRMAQYRKPKRKFRFGPRKGLACPGGSDFGVERRRHRLLSGFSSCILLCRNGVRRGQRWNACMARFAINMK